MRLQYQKMLNMMATDTTRYWRATDFMQQGLGDNFIGYEASARLTELIKKMPERFDVKMDGRFRTVKLLPRIQPTYKGLDSFDTKETKETQESLFDMPEVRKYKAPKRGLA